MGNFKLIELNTIFRQKDDVYIGILNSIRNGTISDSEIALLNKRCNKYYDIETETDRIVLCGHNATVDEINRNQKKKLSAKEHIFKASMTGKYADPSSEINFSC